MANTYVAIATTTVGSGGAATIDFTSIPQTYTDLIIKISGRLEPTSGLLNTRVRFNSDTGTNYQWRRLYGDGSATGSDSGNTQTNILTGITPGSTTTSNTFSNVEIYIPNYTSSNQKSISVDSVSENNSTTSYLEFIAGLWTGTAAINNVTVYQGTFNFAQYSTATLYGIKKD